MKRVLLLGLLVVLAAGCGRRADPSAYQVDLTAAALAEAADARDLSEKNQPGHPSVRNLVLTVDAHIDANDYQKARGELGAYRQFYQDRGRSYEHIAESIAREKGDLHDEE